MIRRLLLLPALALCTLAAAAEPWTLDTLMQRLADRAGGRVNFIERKYIAILDEPVVSTGQMSFTPPGRLERQTVTPKPETMVLDGDRLSIRREGRELDLRLRDYPEAAAFIDSIRGTLAGDRQALERRFLLSLGGDATAWWLDLLPRDGKLAELVLRIHIEGQGGHIRSVEILQGDGDRSVMTLEPADAAQPPA
ncbi:MAG: outer membrane lipoprotein carrier protein LolA [Rhodocyclaceae bacterium]|nr:outer membrane lipoprotein carrier protein LolA [Rhodocyclaceae bacterium]